ncbi:MAG TPA: fibronectin type III domain-containing protein [Candidatus Angelobacter sp.]
MRRRFNNATLLVPMSVRLFTLLLAVTMLTGCGVPGAPLPPSAEVPKFVGDLKAVRKGDTVSLTWTVPTETTDGELIRKPGKMLVQRALISGPDAVPHFQTISELPLEPSLKDDRHDAATAKDSLAEAMRSGAADFAVYAVLAQGHNGKSFGLPNRASVPLVPDLAPPQKITANPVPTGVKLSWEERSLPEKSSRIQTEYAYKIMRREQGANNVNSAVLIKQLSAGSGETDFIDTGIEWEKNYQYWIVPVTLWQAGNRKGEIEGEDSPIINVFAHDSFPPATPSGLEAVFSPAPQNPFIDLTWTPNTEPDLAGYNVYRHGANEPPTKINSELVKTPRFPDPGIQPGMKYFYSVTAVDLRGNESGKSEETTETVPKQ